MFVYAEWTDFQNGKKLIQMRVRFTLQTSIYHTSHFKANHTTKKERCPNNGFLYVDKEGMPTLCIHESPQIRMITSRGYRSKGNNIFSSETHVNVGLLKDAVTRYLEEKHDPLTHTIKISIVESL